MVPPGCTLEVVLEHQMVPSGTEINARRATNTSPSTATSALSWDIAVLADPDTFFLTPPGTTAVGKVSAGTVGPERGETA